jgi:TetR/AcrR family transcriptional regulator of autoinduction and epiphytic fitness
MMAEMGDVKQQRIPRREQAARTRLRLAEAAATLFEEKGYAATTMELVAREAGVAVQTVYFVFHTKPQLLVETIRMLGGGSEGAADVMARSWIQDVVAAPDGARRLALAIEYGSLIYQRIGGLWPTVVAALGEPEVRAAWGDIVQRRRDGMRRIIDLMAARGELRAGLDPALASDILFGLHRHEVYLAFTREAGWSFDRYRAWTFVTLCAQLLPAGQAGDAVRPGSAATADLELARALEELAAVAPDG